jgi:peptidoglycan/LPS O-acetylase OafA/YrhL
MPFTHQNRIFGLDFLRAIAILQVVQGHAYKLHYQFWDYTAWDSKIISFAIFNFVDGVDLFFVLSGFLIGGILIKNLENQPKNIRTLWNFWVRRWFRTLPLYYLVLSINILVFCFIFSENAIIGLKNLWQQGVLQYFFFIQNFTKTTSFFGESWSLAIEEWAYLVLPILFLGIIRFGNLSVKTSILGGIITILILSMVARFIFWISILPNTQLIAWDIQVHLRDITPFRLDAIALGIFGSWVNYYFQSKWLKFRWLSLVIGLTFCFSFKEISALTLQNIKHSSGLLFVMIENVFGCFGILCLLPVLTTWKIQKGIFGKVIEHISLISYSLYLLNLTFLIGLIEHFLPPHSIQDSYLNLTIYWIVLIGLSTLTYYYFEKPMMELREHFLTSSTSPTKSQSPEMLRQ